MLRFKKKCHIQAPKQTLKVNSKHVLNAPVTDPGRQFSFSLPLSIRSLFCLFQTNTNDTCWVCKSRIGKDTNWQGKIKISPGTGEAS